MRLWLLRPATAGGPWEPWYDKNFGFVVRAERQEDARALAAAEDGDENPNRGTAEGSPWLDPALSTCTELAAAGDAEVIISDFRAA